MTLYEFLLFLHVLAAIAWVGGALYVVLVTEVALRARDQELVIRLLHYDDRLAPLLYIPAGLLVLGAGIGLVLDGNLDMTENGWIMTGLIVLVLAFAVGFAFFLPAAKRLKEAVTQSGPGSTEARAQLDRIRLVTWVDLLLLVFAVFVMTTKPF